MSDKRFYLGQPSGSLRDTKNNDERVRHVDLMNEFHARLTALERAGENMGTKFGPDESLHCHVCGQAEVTCNCDRPSPALPEMEIREFLTPKPKVVNVRLETPTAATVEITNDTTPATVRVPLSGKRGAGVYAIIDGADASFVLQHNWYLLKRKSSPKLSYVYACINRKTVFLHRFLLNPPPKIDVDHIDGDGLNNTRRNIRVCSRSENNHNQHNQRPGKQSKYIGVTMGKGGRWVAQIRKDRKTYKLGTFPTEDAAHEAYLLASVKLYGDRASKGESHE